MKIECSYNKDLRQWEFLFFFENKYIEGSILASLSESDKMRYLENWLNNCFRQIHEQEASK